LLAGEWVKLGAETKGKVANRRPRPLAMKEVWDPRSSPRGWGTLGKTKQKKIGETRSKRVHGRIWGERERSRWQNLVGVRIPGWIGY